MIFKTNTIEPEQPRIYFAWRTIHYKIVLTIESSYDKATQSTCPTPVLSLGFQAYNHLFSFLQQWQQINLGEQASLGLEVKEVFVPMRP